jgi:hypothetical protein
MALDPLADPEVRRLLDEADNAAALVDAMGPGGDAAAALGGIYEDLGRALHRLLREPRAADEAPTWQGGAEPLASDFRWNDADDEDEPTVIDRPVEQEDAGLVTRRGRRR